MNELIKKWRESRKKSEQKRRFDEVRHTFCVDIIDGNFVVMCGRYVIKTYDSHHTTLNEAVEDYNRIVELATKYAL